MKQGKYSPDYPRRCVFRETFNDRQSVMRNGGVITDTVTFSNGVATLDGDSATIDYAGKVNDVSGEFSLRAIITMPDVLRYNVIFAYDEYTSIELRTDNDGLIVCYVASSKKTTSVTAVNGTKYEIVVTRDSSNSVVIYVNNSATSGTILAGAFRNKTIHIGARAGSSLWYEGDIELIEFYDYCLSSSDVSNLYNNRRYQELSRFQTGKQEILHVTAERGVIEDRYGAILTVTDLEPGKDGDSCVIKGSGAATNIDLTGASKYQLSEAMSVVVWVKNESGQGNTQTLIFYNTSSGILIRLQADDDLQFYHGGLNLVCTAVTEYDVDNSWHMYVFSSDGSANTYIYQDGLLKNTSSGSISASFSGDLVLLNNLNKNTRVNGLRMYSGILTAAEISQMYSSERKKYGV